MIKIPRILGHTAVVRASCVYDYKCLHFLYSVRHSKSITKAKYKKQQKIIFFVLFYIILLFRNTLSDCWCDREPGSIESKIANCYKKLRKTGNFWWFDNGQRTGHKLWHKLFYLTIARSVWLLIHRGKKKNRKVWRRKIIVDEKYGSLMSKWWRKFKGNIFWYLWSQVFNQITEGIIMKVGPI